MPLLRRETGEQIRAFCFVLAKQAPQAVYIRKLKIVSGKLFFFRQPDIGILYTRRPLDLIHAVDVLQKRDNALESISDLGRNEFQIHTAALLEIGKLRDLETVEHHLPANAPSSQRWRFPVIFFELNIVFAKIDADRAEATEILIQHIVRRGLQNNL